MARIQSGERTAEGLLVERYERPVRAMLRQRLGQSADVDDFLQETLGLVLDKVRRGQVREPGKLGAFVLSVGRNLVIEHFRRLARRKTEGDSYKVAQYEATTVAPDSLLLTRERARLVRRLMDDLPSSRDREILVRFYLDEEEKHTICEDLGLSSLHFNRVLHRARGRYRQLYQDRFEAV